MKVFIGCSSSEQLDSIYYTEARRVASYLAGACFDLLVGGICGVMNVVIEQFVNNNREILIMEADCYRSKEKEYSYPVYNHETISLRKADLINKADLIVFLPGGIGTLDEIFTAIESRRAGEHNKKIIILNINKYYDNLIKMLDNMYDSKFASIDNKKVYTIINNYEDFTYYIDNLCEDSDYDK